VECVSGILVVQDVVQNPEKQALKAYFGEISSLPDGSDITAHTAEVLRLVEGANIPKGVWVGGDSWFGSTATAVEVMNKFGVHSSCIIKQNQQWFPMKPLFAILKAHYKDHPAGHWVTFQATISGVNGIAMAYAWSQRWVSCILSTCGSTAPAQKMYTSYFEDDYGNVGSKEISHPGLAHLLYIFYLLLMNIINNDKKFWDLSKNGQPITAGFAF
jgi:hypothetical protein